MSVRLQVLGPIDLRGAGGEEVRSLLVQPKRLMLLAYLVLARAGGFCRRDSLVALFWPESDALRARLSLRQALHFLRQSLGDGVVVARGAEEVGIAGDGCWCDVVAFEKALDGGRWREGLALYRGDLLHGFFASNLSSEVEQWLEGERIRMRARAAAAAAALCRDAEQARNGIDASLWARRAFQFTPDDESHLRRLVTVLDRWGDRAGALRDYEKFARQLKQELGVEPEDQTRALIAAVRARVNHADAPPSANVGPLEPVPSGGDQCDGQLVAASPRIAGASERAPVPVPVASRRWARRVAAFAIVLLSSTVGIVALVPSALQESVPASAMSSPDARRFYEGGLRAYERGEWRAAHRLFLTALSVDSSFSMAAYYAAMSIRPFRTDSQFLLLEKAAQLAERAPERERLVISHARYALDARRRGAMAESLLTAFPSEPEGHAAVAKEHVSAGDFAGGLSHAQRAIVAASLIPPDGLPACPACDAYGVLTTAYNAMGIDSFPAVERAAREWIAHRPTAAAGWLMLAKALSWRGLRDDAVRALGEAAALEPRLAHMYEHPSSVPALVFENAVIRGEAYEEAERELRDRLRFDERDGEATWWLINVLRHQGRIREAFTLAQEADQLAIAAGRELTVTPVQAQLLFELGRFREAASHFEVLTRGDDPFDPGNNAWRGSWNRLHMATALAAAGDTNGLADLAASIERLADSSSFGLAARLPSHVRGLLWLARGAPAQAAQELRAAIYSPTLGYTRTNLELARANLALGKPKEAVRFLREALGGSSDGPAYYLTRTEIHHWLGRAFEATGEADSAAVHYRAVRAAWRNADPPYRSRADSAAKWLAAFNARRQEVGTRP
jgi:serine/threonine-protein kinase